MIDKINFRDQVRKYLLSKMRDGTLKVGDSVSLAQLARDLDVSITPIREALSQLQHSKIIEAIPNRGFIIPQLNKQEAENIYALVAEIESLAILNSKFTDSIIKVLKKKQIYFENRQNALDRVNADIDFHEVLTSTYNNAVATSILTDLKARIFFYELGFMNFSNLHESSESMHNEIIEAIENNDLSKASAITKQNWLQILNFMNL